MRPARTPARRRGAARRADGRAGAIVVGARTGAGDTFHVELHRPGRRARLLDELGEMPLPPYITTRLDRPDRYQTVYARQPGLGRRADGRPAPHARAARAASGGGRRRPRRRARRRPRHVPAGQRARPARPPHAQRALPRAGGDVGGVPARAERVVAVGTTSVRALESAAATGRPRRAHRAVPPPRRRRSQVVDVLLTNFHLPRTTLLMMIDAFVGPRWRTLYADGAGRGLPLLVVRRRHAARPARSVASVRLHPVQLDVEATRRRGARRRRPRRPAAPTARRASCRSAPAARSST